MRKITRKLCMFLFTACISVFTIQAQDLFEGWNDGDTPGDAGWTNSDGAAWNPIGGDNAYRESIYTVLTKCIVTGYAPGRIYAYPLTLRGGKFYSFSGHFGAVNGGEPNMLIDFNTSADKSGTSLYATQYGGAQTTTNIYLDFNFYVPNDGTYYFTYVSTTNCRGIIGTLSLTEQGDARVVSFDTNGGSAVDAQYFLEGTSYVPNRPTTDPTKPGYTFNGWYDVTLTTEYNFSTSVTSDITIYAKWEDTKEEIKALILSTQNLLNNGTPTAKGQEFLKAAIAAAQVVVDNGSATPEEVTDAFEELTDAIIVYQDTNLSNLLVAGAVISGFSPTTFTYNYSLDLTETLVPSVTATGSVCAEVLVSTANQLLGTTTITVTAGNGETQNYSVNFVMNYLTGWDGNDTDKTTPGEAGWLSPNNITWSALNTAAGRNCYRDGLASGGNIRALVGNPSNRYAYPISGLTVGKVYTFTCAYKFVSNGNEGEDRRWTFGANTSIDGDDATMLNKVTGITNSTGSVGTATFSFVYSGETSIYLVWNGNAAAYAIDNLLLVESDDAIKVVFNSNGGSVIEDKYVLGGSLIAKPENPSKEGYTFMGWYSDAELTVEYNFSESVTSDITLYAKWESGSIEPSVNLIAGWDGNDTDKTTPGEAGWLSPNDITWNALNTVAGRNCYRDGLATGGSIRALVGSPNSRFAYPLSGLIAGKVYTFTVAYKYVSDGDPGEARRWTFGANTSIDGDEATMLNKVTGTVNSTGSVGTATFSFVYSGETPIYLVWNGSAAAYAIDNLLLVEAGDAVEAITITAEELPSLVNGALLTIEYLTLEGSFTSGDINTLAAKLAGNNVLTSVDLINASVDADATDIFAGLNNNALKYFADGATVPTNWTNAVVGNTADEIILTDGASFNNIQAFNAASISYTRTFAAGWSTFCLPFSIDDIANLGTIEEFDEVKENAISFVTANSIAANVPYLINTDAMEKVFSASNVEVPVTNPQTGEFNATFKTLPKEESTGKFILVEEDGKELFLRASANATIPAFRAYISMPNNSEPRYSVMHDGEGGTTNIAKVTSDKNGLDIYSSNGVIVMTAAVAQQVTITGIDGYRVRTVVLAAGESVTINDLAAGIYLVNNQKVVVR